MTTKDKMDRENQMEELEHVLDIESLRRDRSFASGCASVVAAMVLATNLFAADMDETLVKRCSEKNMAAKVEAADDVYRKSDIEPEEREITERYDLPKGLLRGMRLASSSNNQYLQDVPEEYRGHIILDPVRVGVTDKVLKKDPQLSLEQAARLYNQIRTEEDDSAKALARFFAGDKAVTAAISAAVVDLSLQQFMVVEAGPDDTYVDMILKGTDLDWIDKLKPWQSHAVYITLKSITNDNR